jgi:hypothetical protein
LQEQVAGAVAPKRDRSTVAAPAVEARNNALTAMLLRVICMGAPYPRTSVLAK